MRYRASEWFDLLLEGRQSDWQIANQEESHNWPVLVIEESRSRAAKFLPEKLRSLDEHTTAERFKEMQIFRVHYVYQSTLTFYLAKQLGSCPHYQIPEGKVSERNAMIHRYNKNNGYSVTIEVMDASPGRKQNEFISVSQGWEGLSDLFQQLDWWQVQTEIVQRMVESRGQRDHRNHDRVDAGCTGNTNQRRTRASLGMSAPNVHHATHWEPMQKLLHWNSVAVRRVFPVHADTIYQTDRERQSIFAEEHTGIRGDFIESNSLISQLVSLGGVPSTRQYLENHTDWHNDDQVSEEVAAFSEVVGGFVMLKNVVHDLVFRHGCVAYGKASCHEYMIRRRKYGPLIREVHQQYQAMDVERATIVPQALPRAGQRWITCNYIHRDKFVFYSMMANRITALCNMYTNLRRPFPFFSLVYCATVGNSVHYFYYMTELMMQDRRLFGFDMSSPLECPDVHLLLQMYDFMWKLKREKKFPYGKVVPRYQPVHNRHAQPEKLIESVDALVDVFTHLLSLPRDELHRQRESLHPWLCDTLARKLHQVGGFIAHTVANVTALCLGPNEMVSMCSHVSIATSTQTWTRVKAKVHASDKDHTEVNRTLLPAISFMTGEPHHAGEEGLCQWGQGQSGGKNCFRTTYPAGVRLTRAIPNSRSPGRLDLVHVSAEGVEGPHVFLSMEFPRVVTSLTDPYWRKGNVKVKKKPNGNKGIRLDNAEFPLAGVASRREKCLPVPDQVKILLKSKHGKAYMSIHGLIVDGMNDHRRVIIKKKIKVRSEEYVAVGLTYPLGNNRVEEIWAPSEFCLHRGKSTVVTSENLRYFRSPEDAYQYIAFYICFVRTELKVLSPRTHQLTQFKKVTEQVSDEEVQESVCDFRVFFTEKTSEKNLFLVIQYLSGSLGVVLLDEFRRPISRVHMKRRNETAVRSGLPGVPETCECLGIRRHGKPVEGSVGVEMAWADGIVSWEDLTNIYRRAPMTCILYATRNNLSRKKVWRGLSKIKKGEQLLSSALPQQPKHADIRLNRSNTRFALKKEQEEERRMMLEELDHLSASDDEESNNEAKKKGAAADTQTKGSKRKSQATANEPPKSKEVKVARWLD